MTGAWNSYRTAFLALAVSARLMVFATSLEAEDWKIETVDGSGPGMSTSMKVDSAGNAHVAYVVDDGNKYPLKYAFWDESVKRWFTMTVDENAGTCSLVLDSKGRPHISYVDYGSGSGSRLRYARWDGSAWKKQVIPLASDAISYFNSIVLDANDAPSISFYEYRGPKFSDFKIRLRTVNWNRTYWEVKTIDSTEGSGKFNSMAIDAKGGIHLAYANVGATTAGLRYAYGRGGSWKLEIIDDLVGNNGEVVGYSVAVALDKEGNPHICYMNVSSPLVKYAVKKNGRWTVEAVEALTSTAYPDRNSIAVDEDGRVYLGYYDPGQGVLKLARREGQQWVSGIVDDNGSGFTSSLQIHRGDLWISYGDAARAVLKVARLNLRLPEVSDLPKVDQEQAK